MPERQRTLSDMQAEFAELQRKQANVFADMVQEVIIRERALQKTAIPAPATVDPVPPEPRPAE